MPTFGRVLSRRTLAWLAFAVAAALSCEKGRAIGQPCDRGEACASGVCTIGLGFSDAVCTQRCRGEGKGTCPQGWKCGASAKQMAAPARMAAQSICVPDDGAPAEPGAPAAAAADASRPKFDDQP